MTLSGGNADTRDYWRDRAERAEAEVARLRKENSELRKKAAIYEADHMWVEEAEADLVRLREIEKAARECAAHAWQAVLDTGQRESLSALRAALSEESDE
jgi:hypothetical protein